MRLRKNSILQLFLGTLFLILCCVSSSSIDAAENNLQRVAGGFQANEQAISPSMEQKERHFAELMHDHRYADALAQHEISFGRNDTNVVRNLARAKIYRSEGKSAIAARILMDAVKLNPQVEALYFELGLLYKLREPKRAISYFKNALKCNQRYLPAYVELAKLTLDKNERLRYCVMGLLLSDTDSIEAKALRDLIDED